jgi:hypothetical protein
MFKSGLNKLASINNLLIGLYAHNTNQRMKHLFLVFLSLTFSVCVFSQTADFPVPDNLLAAVYEQSEATPDYSGQASDVAAPETDVITEKTLNGIFETFFALVAFIPIAVQFLRKLIIPNATGIGAQIFSWTVGIAITLSGWLLHLGFLDGLSFWIALLYGAGACLAANGIFDTGLISALFGLFGKKVATNR